MKKLSFFEMADTQGGSCAGSAIAAGGICALSIVGIWAAGLGGLLMGGCIAATINTGNQC